MMQQSQLLGVSKEMEIHVQTKTCIRMFTAALFLITKKWKQLKWLATDKRIYKVYLGVKKNKYEVMIHVTKYMKLENVLSDRS